MKFLSSLLIVQALQTFALPTTKTTRSLAPNIADILSKPPFAIPPSSDTSSVTAAQIWGSQDVQKEQDNGWLSTTQYYGITDVEQDAPISNVHASATNQTTTPTATVNQSPSDVVLTNTTGPQTHTVMVNPNPGGYTFSFVPNRLNISVGDSVQWIWVDQMNIHSVVELTGDPEQDTALCFVGNKVGGIDSGQRAAPYRMTQMFDASFAGQTVYYACMVSDHCVYGMTGSITISGSQPASTQVVPTSTSVASPTNVA